MLSHTQLEKCAAHKRLYCSLVSCNIVPDSRVSWQIPDACTLVALGRPGSAVGNEPLMHSTRKELLIEAFFCKIFASMATRKMALAVWQQDQFV